MKFLIGDRVRVISNDAEGTISRRYPVGSITYYEVNIVGQPWSSTYEEKRLESIEDMSEFLQCFHEYAQYKGFTDIFEYCIHCDKRKD